MCFRPNFNKYESVRSAKNHSSNGTADSCREGKRIGFDLSNNRLTGAPQSQIGQLKNLKSLDLSGNSLTGLPAELGQLKKLETLNVSNNQLTGLPMELGDLTQLRVFDVSGNAYSAQDLDGIASKLTSTDIRR
jgi:leucine-rich repeat protein SHOC2